MDPALGVAVLALLGTLATGAFTYRAATKATRVNESSDQRQWVVEAGKEAREARREAAEAHRQLTAIREHADAIELRMRRLAEAVWDPVAVADPVATIDRLRKLLPNPGANGGRF